jgi:hypothetical protein
MDCLPVLGQLTLRLVRSARFFGRVFPSYKSPMLCFSTGPSVKITKFAMSCVPPHLLQRATILYRAAELFGVGGVASFMPSFSCMTARIVRCFGHSVKNKERGNPRQRRSRWKMERANEAAWKVGAIPQRNLQDHSHEELRRAMEFRHSLRPIGSRCCEKGKGDSRLSDHPL